MHWLIILLASPLASAAARYFGSEAAEPPEGSGVALRKRGRVQRTVGQEDGGWASDDIEARGRAVSGAQGRGTRGISCGMKRCAVLRRNKIKAYEGHEMER